MKTLKDCKEEIAKRKGYKSWEQITRVGVVQQQPESWFDEVAELYASQFREPSTEQSGGTEQEEFAMKFLEYASGLAVSNYKSGGNWYLGDGRIVKTADILKQFKEESKP